MKSRIIVCLVLTLFGASGVYAQLCEKPGSVEIRLQDEDEKNVSDASIRFVELPEGNLPEGLEFVEHKQSYGSLYVSRFCQSGILAKTKPDQGFRRYYDISVKAKGFKDTTAKIGIYHCFGSCLVNQSFVTVISESARLVTFKGSVKAESSTTNEKGQVVRSQKRVAGAPITFKRHVMVSFFTTSDADGNYKITLPEGKYSVYATAAPGCYMCSEYFGNVVGSADPTALDIDLRFYGEGYLGFTEYINRITRTDQEIINK